LDWVQTNKNGGSKLFLLEPCTWKTHGGMNVGFLEKRQAATYDEAKTMLLGSHAEAMALIESLSDEELFEKKRFSWTGTTNVGSCCISAAPSRYDWAMKEIKQLGKGKKRANSRKSPASGQT
jgi:hypothetical protein